MMISGAFTLREAERKAKKERLNMWRNYAPPAGSSTKQSGKFTGAVTEVVSGDVLVVKDAASGAERRVTISSIRAPRAGRRDEKAEPYGTEAKEFLRSRLIGEGRLQSAQGCKSPPLSATMIAARRASGGLARARVRCGRCGLRCLSSRYWRYVPARSGPLNTICS